MWFSLLEPTKQKGLFSSWRNADAKNDAAYFIQVQVPRMKGAAAAVGLKYNTKQTRENIICTQ